MTSLRTSEGREPIFEVSVPIKITFRSWRHWLALVVLLSVLVVAAYDLYYSLEPEARHWGHVIWLPLMVLVCVFWAIVFPAYRLSAYADHLVIGGWALWRHLRVPYEEVVSVRAVTDYPFQECVIPRRWGWSRNSKWRRYVPFFQHRGEQAVAIETTGFNYLFACPDPTEVAAKLRATLGIGE
jgi:hypothetical protein